MILEIKNLDVHYGRAHALQGVSLSLDHGVVAVVGRNGMGKTTLCNAVTGLVAATGSIRLAGEEILGLAPNAINDRGVGYVPQGRRVWPSLSVDEHLRLAARGNRGVWTVERVTVMHNGQVLKHGTPSEIENDAEVRSIYMGGRQL